MTDIVIATVVEGFGEVAALPVLLRRLAQRRGLYVHCPEPFRRPRTSLIRAEELCKAVRFTGARVGDAGGVLVLADADDDCPVDLRQRMDGHLGNHGAAVVIAAREYESWFLAAVESLRGHRSVLDDAAFPGDPECPRGAKERLGHLMCDKYRETQHQAAFSELIDLDVAEERSRSFRRLVRAVDVLLGVQC